MGDLFSLQAIAPVGSKFEGVPLDILSNDDLRDLVVQCARNQRLLRDVDYVRRHRARRICSPGTFYDRFSRQERTARWQQATD